MNTKSKDPAFLFFPADFLVGTQFMTPAQVGYYIRLLCIQHQHGHLTLQQMLSIVGMKDPEVFEKFKIDEAGKYFNIRLEHEIEKRKGWCQSRRDNAKGGKKKLNEGLSEQSKHVLRHMINRNKNINVIEDEVENGKAIDERKNNFMEKVAKFKNDYSKDMLMEFFQYWTEHNEGADEMRFEQQAFFDYGKRLATWKRNSKKFSRNQKFTEDDFREAAEKAFKQGY